MANSVICQGCGKLVSVEEKVVFNKQSYHLECAQQAKDRKELLDYICKIFHFKKPGPIVFRQLKSYLEKYPHYTYKGIHQALSYYYEVLNRPVKDEVRDWGIGIVPHIYDQAQEYYYGIQKQQERVAEEISQALSAEPEIKKIVITKKEKKQKDIYDLENL